MPEAGDLFAPETSPLGVPTYAGRSWFKTVSQSKACVSEPFALTPDGRPAMTVACPALGWDGQVKAVVAAAMTLDGLLHSADAATDGVVGVLAPDGVLLAAHPAEAAAVGTQIVGSGLARTVLASPSGNAEVPGLGGSPKLVGFDRLLPGLSGSPTVFVEIPLEEAYAPARKLLVEQTL